MNDATLNKIKEHLEQSEGELKHPYLDIKGKVTAGVGNGFGSNLRQRVDRPWGLCRQGKNS